MRLVISDWMRALRDLILPGCGCACCGRPLPAEDDPFCPECLQTMAETRWGWQPCGQCATFVPLGTAACRCCADTRRGNSLVLSRASYPYEGIIKESIRHFKYHRRVWLAKPLGRLMLATADAAGLGGADLLIPVPLHPARLRERGYNQAELLARVLAQGLDLPLDTRSLIRCQNTPSQTALQRAQRLANPQNAFALTGRAAIKEKRILLVDDIFTTGATAAACARVLLAGGAAAVSLISCAAGKQQNLAN